jgi:hypothetical protein
MREIHRLPHRLLSRGREHGSIGVSDVGHEEEEMVWVLPTLLPKRRNAELVKNHKVTICRENPDGP